MASAAPRERVENHSREAHNEADDPLAARPPNFLLNLLTYFGASLILALSTSFMYRLVVHPVHPIQVDQLMGIASFMDEIYTTLANLTFIPPTAIKRGPHIINTTAIPCVRDPSVLRLLEVMPYVHTLEAMKQDDILRTEWLFGGGFVDYRDAEHLEQLCDPLRMDQQISPTSVALTRWGTGGHKGDHRWVMLYDTARNAIRVYEGDFSIHLHDEEVSTANDDYTNSGIFTHNIYNKLYALDQGHELWERWFDAPTLLNRILTAYQTLEWTPWETCKREGGSVIEVSTIPTLLRSNGWPHSFDPNQFNSDFIRAKHAPFKYGPAKRIFDVITEMEGGDQKHKGFIETIERQITSWTDELPTHTDEQDYWYWICRIQLKEWELAEAHAKLAAAKQAFQDLCPNNVCVKDVDLILWEQHAIQKSYEKAKHCTPNQSCEDDLTAENNWVPPAPELLQNCIAHRTRAFTWLECACNQSTAEALLRHDNLLLQPTLEDRVREKIADLRAEAKNEQNRAVEMYAWLPMLPDHAEKARTLFAMAVDAKVNRPWYCEEEIAWLQEHMGSPEGRERVSRVLDEEEEEK